MKNKKALVFSIVTLLMLGLYNLIIFLIKSEFPKNFWISYGFISFGFLLVVISSLIANNKINYQKTTGLPITVLSCMYCVLELFLGTIFICIPSARFTLVFLTQIIILVLTLAIYIPSVLTYYMEAAPQPKNDNTTSNNPENK